MARTIKISGELYESAKLAAKLSNRTIDKQIEFWIDVGRAGIQHPNLTSSDIAKALTSQSKIAVESGTRYTLDELLAKWDPEIFGCIKDEEWLEMRPMGKEIW